MTFRGNPSSAGIPGWLALLVGALVGALGNVQSAADEPQATGGPRLRFELPAGMASATEAEAHEATPRIELRGADARWQLLVTLEAVDDRGQPITRDATRSVLFRVEPPELADIDASGYLVPRASGGGRIVATLASDVAIAPAGSSVERPPAPPDRKSVV